MLESKGVLVCPNHCSKKAAHATVIGHTDNLALVFENFPSALLLLKQLWIVTDATGTGSLTANSVSAHS